MYTQEDVDTYWEIDELLKVVKNKEIRLYLLNIQLPLLYLFKDSHIHQMKKQQVVNLNEYKKGYLPVGSNK